jgi:heterodisulfide reductase subunit C
MGFSPSTEFADIISKVSGVDINLCYQCGKCSSGCPTNYIMDILPHQMIHAIRLGLEDRVFGSRTVWLCASCQTCTTRCPHGIDTAGVMDCVKVLAFQRGKEPAVKTVSAFYKSALTSIRLTGRLYELGMIMEYKLRTMQLLKDLGLGLKMFARGKMKIIPSMSINRIVSANKIFSRVRKRDKQYKK